jgi:hypothetical protein
MTAWTETYESNSPEQERLVFDQLARDIMGVQLKAQKAAKAGAVQRTFHAKAGVAVQDAQLVFHKTLPKEFRVGFAKPGARYPAIVRLSNAAGSLTSDYDKDMRGLAVRIAADVPHDLLATNYPVSHARNARQFVAFAQATAGGAFSKLFGLLGLAFKVGPFETLRMLGNVSKARRRSNSYALETYWSRGAIAWGDLAVRYLWRPLDAPPVPALAPTDPDGLAHEFATRLSAGDVAFELCLQVFVDERLTPIEDTAIEWTQGASSPIPVATLTLPRKVQGFAEARAQARGIDLLAFNPWNTGADFRPLGNLNRARKAAYDASAAHRLEYKWRTDAPLRNVVFGAIARAVFRFVNRFVEWHKLPVPLSLLNLDGFRYVLRRKNLFDTEIREAPPQPRAAPVQIEEGLRTSRTFIGTHNDLSDPKMGAAGATFGRNLKPDLRPATFDTPNAFDVAKLLMHRKSFIPATSLNILAAAWIQFQVHDWVNHARNPLGQGRDLSVSLPPGMKWRNTVGGPDEDVMRIAGNVRRNEGAKGDPPTLFGNAASHWWDGSEVYGDDDLTAKGLREGPKIKLVNGYLPKSVKGFEITGFNESFWLGLSGMHTLFAREHNLLCDELKSHYRGWSDDQIYNTARLIVTALIAKIHTVEWTPAILATETIKVALNTNWNGPPGDLLTKGGIWLLDAHSATGIPKTKPDHQSAPYSLTEDFATVYRLHPLIPDDFCFFDHKTGRKIDEKRFLEIQGANTDAEMRKKGLENVLYSFGTSHPGAITLHNFPISLTGFERDNELIDLAVVDIVRTRRRGVPRYNDFRAGLHKPRITRWEDLAADPETVRILKDLYKDIDQVDTVIGLLGENPPAGFGFSDTAFRIFILMASRRLQSDRFLTVDFRPEVYSPFGMDWIANNGMTSLILRHCPQLASVLPRDASAFAPWRPIIPQ